MRVTRWSGGAGDERSHKKESLWLDGWDRSLAIHTRPAEGSFPLPPWVGVTVGNTARSRE